MHTHNNLYIYIYTDWLIPLYSRFNASPGLCRSFVLWLLGPDRCRAIPLVISSDSIFPMIYTLGQDSGLGVASWHRLKKSPTAPKTGLFPVFLSKEWPTLYGGHGPPNNKFPPEKYFLLPERLHTKFMPKLDRRICTKAKAGHPGPASLLVSSMLGRLPVCPSAGKGSLMGPLARDVGGLTPLTVAHSAASTFASLIMLSWRRAWG